jgi:hypothetical protein
VSVERALGGIAAATDGSSWSEDDLIRQVNAVKDPDAKRALQHVAHAVIDLQRKMYMIFVATHEFLPHADPALGEMVREYAAEVAERQDVDESARFVAAYTRRLHESVEPLHRALLRALLLSAERDWQTTGDGGHGDS